MPPLGWPWRSARPAKAARLSRREGSVGSVRCAQAPPADHGLAALRWWFSCRKCCARERPLGRPTILAHVTTFNDAFMRLKDWFATSLGDPADWPQSPKVAMRDVKGL